MPFLLTAIGLVLIVTGVRDTHLQLAAQVQKDFTGQQSFMTWLLAIGAVGSLGYIDNLRTFSHYFLALILIAMVLSNRGFFQQFNQQWNAGPLSPSVTSGASSTAGTVTSAQSAATMTQGGLFGQSPATQGQATFNGWMNYFFSGGWLK